MRGRLPALACDIDRGRGSPFPEWASDEVSCVGHQRSGRRPRLFARALGSVRFSRVAEQQIIKRRAFAASSRGSPSGGGEVGSGLSAFRGGKSAVGALVPACFRGDAAVARKGHLAVLRLKNYCGNSVVLEAALELGSLFSANISRLSTEPFKPRLPYPFKSAQLLLADSREEPRATWGVESFPPPPVPFHAPF